MPVDDAMMLNDSSDDRCGSDRDVMRWPDVECETMQYERGVRPAIGRKPPGKTRFPAVFLSANPSLQRHYERRTAKIDADRRHRQQSLERAQKVFFLHQAFDHDSNLRFGQQIAKNRVDNDTEQVRHPKQKRLLDVISSHGAMTATVSLPRLGVADNATQHTSHSPDDATRSPSDDGSGPLPQGYIQGAIATKSAPDVATVREDVDTCPTVSATESSPAVCQVEQICDNNVPPASTLRSQQKRHVKKIKAGKDFRRQLSTIAEPVGHAYFTTSTEKQLPAHREQELTEMRPTEAVQKKGEETTRESVKQDKHPVTKAVEDTKDSRVNFQLVAAQPVCLPPIATKTFITASAKTSHVPLGNLPRGISLLDRSANTQDESPTSHDNEIIARITRTLPAALMRKMTLNEALMTHKKRLLDNSRKFASRDLFSDPRWKRLESVLKDAGNRL